MEIERQKLRKYLLGDLPEKFAEEIDLRIISDTSLEDELRCAEDDLMEDYLEGLLSPVETELFHRNFLTSDERQNLLEHLKLIKEYAQNISQKTASKELSIDRPKPLTQKLRGFFENNLRPLRAVFALLVLCLLIGASWRLFFYSQPTNDLAQSESEFAELNKQDLTDLSALKDLSTVNLISGTFRESAAVKRLTASQLGERVLFRLALLSLSVPTDSYQVKMRKDGQELFSPIQVPSYGNQSGREIRLIVPSTWLKSGDYEIDVSQGNSGNSVISYSFSVR